MNAEEALQKMPAEIRRVENEVFKRKQDLEGLRLKLRLREADLAQGIALAKDDATGKARYPNADARDAALRAAMEGDDDARGRKRAVIEEEALISRMQSTLDYYRDVQRNARVLLLARSPATLVFEDPELAR